MHKFAEWLQIREGFGSDVIIASMNNPKANVYKLAKIMRDQGYNVGSSDIFHVISRWKKGNKVPSKYEPMRFDPSAKPTSVKPIPSAKPTSVKPIPSAKPTSAKTQQSWLEDDLGIHLKQAIFGVLDKQPHLDPNQLKTALSRMGILVELWQILAVMKQHEPKSGMKIDPDYDPYNVNYPKPEPINYTYKPTPSYAKPDPAYMWKPQKSKIDYSSKQDEPFFAGDNNPSTSAGYFNQGTGGGTRIRRSTRYN